LMVFFVIAQPLDHMQLNIPDVIDPHHFFAASLEDI